MLQLFQTQPKCTKKSQSVLDDTAYSLSLCKVLAVPLNSVFRREKIIIFYQVLEGMEQGDIANKCYELFGRKLPDEYRVSLLLCNVHKGSNFALSP